MSSHLLLRPANILSLLSCDHLGLLWVLGQSLVKNMVDPQGAWAAQLDEHLT